MKIVYKIRNTDKFVTLELAFKVKVIFACFLTQLKKHLVPFNSLKFEEAH